MIAVVGGCIVAGAVGGRRFRPLAAGLTRWSPSRSMSLVLAVMLS